MKNLIITIAAIFFISANTLANDARIFIMNENSIVLTVYDIKDQFEVIIIDNSGRKLFSDKYNNIKEFYKEFNLSSLPSGTYNLKLSDAVHNQNFEIKKSKTEIQVKEIENYKVFEPSIVVNNENQLVINFLSINKVSSATIQILNKNDELVSVDSLKGENNFGKIYDFSKLPTGTYIAQVIIDNKIYTKEFKK